MIFHRMYTIRHRRCYRTSPAAVVVVAVITTTRDNQGNVGPNEELRIMKNAITQVRLVLDVQLNVAIQCTYLTCRGEVNNLLYIYLRIEEVFCLFVCLLYTHTFLYFRTRLRVMTDATIRFYVFCIII